MNGPRRPDPEKVKGWINLALGVVLLAFAVVAIAVGRYVVTAIAGALGALDLGVAYLYLQRGGTLGSGKQRTGPR